MRRIHLHTLVLTLFLGLGPQNGVAQRPAEEAVMSARLHPWGLFNPGAWKMVRVITETLNEQGQVVSTSTSDTTTTLVDLDNEGVTLEIRACMEVAGKRFEPDAQIVKQGFHGEMLGPHLTIKRCADSRVLIEGREIPCTVQQLESVVPNGKTVTTIYYSMTVAPYVLKRESVTIDPEGKDRLGETISEVISLSVPLKIRGETRDGVKLKTVVKNANSTTTTLADILPEVPGGVVGNKSKELNKEGRLVRRSELELRDYNANPEQDRNMRPRKRHRTKTPPYYGP